MGMYPNLGRQKPQGEGPDQIKRDEEEIAILTRVNRINQIYPNSTDLMSQVVDTQIKLAKSDLEKNKAAEAAKGKGASQSPSSNPQ